MAYQCQNFKNGQTLTAECLNRIEQGILDACKDAVDVTNLFEESGAETPTEYFLTLTENGMYTLDDGYINKCRVVNNPHGTVFHEISIYGDDGYNLKEFYINGEKVWMRELEGDGSFCETVIHNRQKHQVLTTDEQKLSDTQKEQVVRNLGLSTTGGGGSETWETIVDYTVPEDCAEVLISEDVNGEAFDLREMIAVVLIQRATDYATANTGIRFVVDRATTRPYFADTGWKGNSATAPTADGSVTIVRIVAKKTAAAVSLLGFTATTTTTGNALYPSGSLSIATSVSERYNAETLMPLMQGITALNFGTSANAAIGAGTRVVIMGVRE